MNMLLSENYRKILEHEHSTTEWGTTGWGHAPYIHKLIVRYNIKSLLDYGSGRGSLGHWFDKHAPNLLERREYEPGKPSLSAPPRPAELVTCIDVMEHVEPNCVINVLDHIQSLSQQWVYFNISLRPAGRKLVDGRNAHLTLQPMDWWCQQLRARWNQQDIIADDERKAFNWFGSLRA